MDEKVIPENDVKVEQQNILIFILDALIPKRNANSIRLTKRIYALFCGILLFTCILLPFIPLYLVLGSEIPAKYYTIVISTRISCILIVPLSALCTYLYTNYANKKIVKNNLTCEDPKKKETMIKRFIPLLLVLLLCLNIFIMVEIVMGCGFNTGRLADGCMGFTKRIAVHVINDTPEEADIEEEE